MSDPVGFGVAFGAGVVSFLSPCVLPLIPGYLSFLTGLSVSQLSAEERHVSSILIPSVLFVAGFTIVFVALGATASVLGSLVLDYRGVIVRIAGVVVFAFGLMLVGVIRVPWLYGEARADMGKARAFGRASAVVMGMAFAAGWTPCVGPVLGAILTLAGASADVSRGVILLAFYSAGLGVPFILVALFFSRLDGLMRWFKSHSVIINRVAGALLMAVGLLILSGRLAYVAAWLTSVLPGVRL